MKFFCFNIGANDKSDIKKYIKKWREYLVKNK